MMDPTDIYRSARSFAKSRSSNWDQKVHWIPVLFWFVTEEQEGWRSFLAASASDHTRISLSHERSERISSKRTETIADVWCHFVPHEKTVV